MKQNEDKYDKGIFGSHCGFHYTKWKSQDQIVSKYYQKRQSVRSNLTEAVNFNDY